jgi:hypothetical protein
MVYSIQYRNGDGDGDDDDDIFQKYFFLTTVTPSMYHLLYTVYDVKYAMPYNDCSFDDRRRMNHRIQYVLTNRNVSDN